MKVLLLKNVSGLTYMLEMKKAMICVCYRAPLTSAQEDEGLIALIINASNEITLVMLDFNFPAIKWESNEASGNEEKYLECMQDSFSTQHVLLHTRGDNILDLVMSNEEGSVENLTVGEPFGISDQCVIKWDMVIKRLQTRIVTELSLIILMWIMHS